MTVLFTLLHWHQKLTVPGNHQPNRLLSFHAQAVRDKQLQTELRQLVSNIRPSSTARQLVKLACVYQEMGRSGDALAVYLQALRKDPNNAEALKAMNSLASTESRRTQSSYY